MCQFSFISTKGPTSVSERKGGKQLSALAAWWFILFANEFGPCIIRETIGRVRDARAGVGSNFQELVGASEMKCKKGDFPWKAYRGNNGFMEHSFMLSLDTFPSLLPFPRTVVVCGCGASRRCVSFLPGQQSSKFHHQPAEDMAAHVICMCGSVACLLRFPAVRTHAKENTTVCAGGEEQLKLAGAGGADGNHHYHSHQSLRLAAQAAFSNHFHQPGRGKHIFPPPPPSQ